MEGDRFLRDELIARHISIHTLRMEGDGLYLYEDIRIEISIHTLRMEGDLDAITIFALKPTYFNPHPPHGG